MDTASAVGVCRSQMVNATCALQLGHTGPHMRPSEIALTAVAHSREAVPPGAVVDAEKRAHDAALRRINKACADLLASDVSALADIAETWQRVVNAR